jgi:hypothetical protein
MTRHAGRVRPSDRPLRTAAHARPPSAEGVLREVALVLHLTRAVRDAMRGGPSRPCGPALTFSAAASEVSA